jgi:hypothetical protein
MHVLKVPYLCNSQPPNPMLIQNIAADDAPCKFFFVHGYSDKACWNKRPILAAGKSCLIRISTSEASAKLTLKN